MGWLAPAVRRATWCDRVCRLPGLFREAMTEKKPWLRGLAPTQSYNCRQGSVPEGWFLPLSGPQISHLYNGHAGDDNL